MSEKEIKLAEAKAEIKVLNKVLNEDFDTDSNNSVPFNAEIQIVRDRIITRMANIYNETVLLSTESE